MMHSDSCSPKTFTTATPGDHPFVVPHPIRDLEHRLIEGLDAAPGHPTLATIFGNPQTVQLELAVDTLIEPLAAVIDDMNDTVVRRNLRYETSRATFLLRRATDDSGPSRPALADAERALARSIGKALSLEPAASNAIAVLWHARLHVHAMRSRGDGDGWPFGLLPLLTEAIGWSRHSLERWRQWSDSRFGPIDCIDWAGDRPYCRSMDYRFNGKAYPIHYVRDRRLHQEREWLDWKRARLQMTCRARDAWWQMHAAIAGDTTVADRGRRSPQLPRSIPPSG